MSTETGRPTEQEWAQAREALILDVTRGFHEFTGGHPDYPLYDEVACCGSPEYHCEAGHEHGSRGVCWACEPPSAHIVDQIIRPLIDRERQSAKAEERERIAQAIEATATDPDRRRPVVGPTATDFANDMQWAARIARTAGGGR